MLEHTKKHHTDNMLVALQFTVHKKNVDSIKQYVKQLEPATIENDSVTLDDFFTNNFAGESVPAVKLRGLRYRESFTQRQLAEAIGIPQRHISEMETGKRPIGKDNAKKLALALNADYRAFL